MEFVTDNYVWFIVGGVVILMAVIGYIADKTDFGRKKEKSDEEETIKPVKEKKEKKPKKEKKEARPEKIEVDAKGIGELTQSLTELDAINTNDNLYAPLDNKEEQVDPSLFAPLEMPAINDMSVTSDEIDQSLFAPLSPVENVVTEPTISENLEAPLPEAVEPEPTVIEELPSVQPVQLDNLVTEENKNTTVAEDEDVWKF